MDDDRPNEQRPQSEPKGEQGKDGEHERKPSKIKRALHNPLVLILGGLALVVIVIAIVLWWLNARQYQSTDDAFIDSHIVHLAPQVAGQIEQVNVRDNAAVTPGELLVQIAPGPFHAQLEQAQGGAAQAAAQLDQARAQVPIDQAKLEQAQASERAAEAPAANAARDLGRYQALRALNPAAVSQQQLDQATSQARNTAAQRDAAQRQVKAAVAQLGSDRTNQEAAAARLKSEQAQMRQSSINLGFTRITAPIAGTVAQRTVALGDYVQPGQQLMAIVPHNVWVTANFKETQLDLMRPGQPVEVKIDACRGPRLRGKVDSIQRGAGQAFALLPAENATGNFVKVVQRVPVKIVLLELPRDCVIGPGMSVTPSVKVR